MVIKLATNQEPVVANMGCFTANRSFTVAWPLRCPRTAVLPVDVSVLQLKLGFALSGPDRTNHLRSALRISRSIARPLMTEKARISSDSSSV